jgi:hypothetical protein
MNRKLLVLPFVVVLSACSTTKQEVKEPVKPVLQEMSREQVIAAARECLNMKMKPDIQHATKKVETTTISVPIQVNCINY